MSVFPSHRPARCAGRVTRAVKSAIAAVALTSAITGDAQKYTSLAGVSFPLGS